MWSHLVDVAALIELRDCVAGLTRSDFTAYDDRGRLLMPPLSHDPIMDIFASAGKGKEEQELFMKNALEKAVLRKGPSLFKGPMNQYHAFIPVHTGDRRIVMAGNAFYASTKDLEDFISSKGADYRLSIKDMALWRRKIAPRDFPRISATCEHVHRLVNLTVKNNYEKNLFRERSLKTSAIMELFSEIEKDMSEERLHSILCDAMLFLFGADTASVMVRTGDQYIPVVTSGNIKSRVEKIPLRCEVSIISDAVNNRRVCICTESIELLRLGFPEEVESLYLFPLSMNDEPLALLCVFNSQLTGEDCGTIMKLCSFSAFLLKTMMAQKVVDTSISSFISLNRALDMSPAFQDPDTLYESIVELSSQLMDAEKVSLMLPQEEQQELSITAVKGINKWIAKNIRVKIGEGVAGRVYQDGKAMMVSDIQSNLSTAKKPNYRTGSFVSIPLKIGDESIGVLNLADKISGEVFSEEDMMFLRYFASYASIAIKGSQYYRKSEELRTLSVTDPLTGLFNRRYFNDRLYEELERGVRYDYVFSLAIFDIDDFKLFNDTEGHLAGDEVLKAVAEISKESLRSIDIISRFGGEEFSIIMPQTNKEEALLVSERVRKNIIDLLPVSWKVFPHDRITVSVGLATFPTDGKDAKTLIRNVDKALYRAKLTGKNRTVVWEAFDPSEGMHEKHLDGPA
jgi:diguanylate cyclase (GGDEF)-like protein